MRSHHEFAVALENAAGASINLGTLTEFGTQMTSSQQGASVIRKLTQAHMRVDRSDGWITL